MNSTVTLDAAGRVLIPKSLREALHLTSGDVLEMASDGARITLRPVRAGARVQKEQGVWVFRRAGPTISNAATNSVLEQSRFARASGNCDNADG